MAVGDCLPVNLTAAEQANLHRAIAQAQERASNQTAGARSVEQAREVVRDIVRGTEEVEGATVQGESRGAHSYTLKKEEGKEPPEPAEPRPPDPEGKGTNLDVQG